MKLIDTHCHLCNGRLRNQTPEVLERATDAGLIAIICAAAHLEESVQAMGLARKYPQVYFTAGVHPHDAVDVPSDYIQQLGELADDPKNVAIGEIGLDYHYNYSPPEDQQRIFAEQLELAGFLGKKIVIHTREAFDDTMRILCDSGVDGATIVFHSCTAGLADVHRALEFGAMISFSGIATFNSAADLREAAAIVPDDRLMIETDAPFLSPEPVRKMKTNEPANVAHVAACLADVRNTTSEAIAELTTANAVRFFGLDI